MRVAFLAFAAVIGAAWLASVNAAVPASRDIGEYQPVAEGCGYGWHWISGYTGITGTWVSGHCLKD